VCYLGLYQTSRVMIQILVKNWRDLEAMLKNKMYEEMDQISLVDAC